MTVTQKEIEEMNTILNANFLYAQIDEQVDVLMIGFADDEFDTKE